MDLQSGTDIFVHLILILIMIMHKKFGLIKFPYDAMVVSSNTFDTHATL